MREKLIYWLESHQLPCMYKKFLGVECPGCGMQRAFIELLKGNFAESIKIFPALIPMIFLVLFLGAHLLFKFRQGAAILKYSFIFTTAIIVIHYLFSLFIP